MNSTLTLCGSDSGTSKHFLLPIYFFFVFLEGVVIGIGRGIKRSYHNQEVLQVLSLGPLCHSQF